MAGRLAGKVALISGGARGQGETEARLFVKEGAKVVLGDILVDLGQKVAADIVKQGGQATFVTLDVTQEADWQRAVDTTVRTYGKLDILVNNAGIFRTEGVEATSMELWNQVIAVNQTGTWLGMKYAVPAIRKAGGGSIVNISSGAGIIGTGMAAAYHGTKGAVRILTKTAAIEYAKDHIRINSVHPGVVDTRNGSWTVGARRNAGAYSGASAWSGWHLGRYCLRRALPCQRRVLVCDGVGTNY